MPVNKATDSAPSPRRHSGQYAGKAATTRRRERKSKLLAAGIALIGDQGFNATSIDAVCARAGLTKRYFYEAFDSRESLLIEAFRAVSTELLQAISQAALPYLGDSRQLVHQGLRATYAFVAAEPAKVRLMFIEALSLRGQLGRSYVESLDGFVQLLLSLTRPFLPPGAASEAELKVMARGAIGAIMHLCQGWIASDFRQPAEELIAGSERLFAGAGRELGIHPEPRA